MKQHSPCFFSTFMSCGRREPASTNASERTLNDYWMLSEECIESQTGAKHRPDCKKPNEQEDSSTFHPKTSTTSRPSPNLEQKSNSTSFLQMTCLPMEGCSGKPAAIPIFQRSRKPETTNVSNFSEHEETAATYKPYPQRVAELGKREPRRDHSVLTQFPEDPNAEECRMTRATREPCENQDETSPPTSLGKRITADHKILSTMS